MAWDTLILNAVKIFLIISIDFQASRKCHVSGTQDLTKEYVFSPNDILQVVEQSCFIGVSKESLYQEDFSDVYIAMQKAFVEEDLVVIGLIDTGDFVWPSGKSLKVKGEDYDARYDILSFSKREIDRTCLSTANLAKPDPVADRFTGIKTIDILVEFINQKCNTYRTKRGYLSIEGLHRQEILNSLFKVKDVSKFDIENLLTEAKGQFCTKDDCKRETNKSSIRKD